MEKVSQQENIQKLQRLAEEDKDVKTVMETLSKRQRYRTKTDLYQFRDQVKKFTGSELGQEDLVKTFRELQSAGIGKLIYKRGAENDKRPRFEWRYSLKDLARATGFGDPLSEPIREISKAAEKKKAEQKKNAAGGHGGIGFVGLFGVVVNLNGQGRVAVQRPARHWHRRAEAHHRDQMAA